MPQIDPALIIGLFNTFAPIVKTIIDEARAHGTENPTDAEVMAKFAADIDRYLGEGAAWTAAHPAPET